MLPRVHVVGNAVADPELRFSPSGVAVAKFRIAANERKKQGDSWVDGDTCFLDVVTFKEKAEALVDAVHKGTPVMVSGRLVQRSYEAKDGTNRTVYEVQADDIATVIRGKSPQRTSGPADDPWASSARPAQDDEPPF